MTQFNIDNYDPFITTDASAILAFYRGIQSQVQGQQLCAVWTVWLEGKNELCEFAPIVLAFEDCSLEVCCLKDDELAVSTNTIDTSKGFALYGFEMPCRWKANTVPDLQSAIGKRLLNVDLLEFRAEGVSVWMLHGIIFMLDGCSFFVYNAFDSNGIAASVPNSSEYRRVSIW